MHVLVLKFFDTRLSDEILEMHQLYSVLNMVYGESPLYIYMASAQAYLYTSCREIWFTIGHHKL